MKILVVTPYLAYPGNDGGSTAMFNFIKNIAGRHEVAYVTFACEQDLVHLPKVAQYCIETVTVPLPGGRMTVVRKVLYLARRVMKNIMSIATFTPVVVQKCMSGAMSVEIGRAVERHKPDVVHFFFPQMAHYVEACQGTPAVMDTSDVALLGVFRRAMSARRTWRTAYYLMQWLFWVRYESRFFPRFGKVLTVTQQHAAALKMVLPGLDVYSGAIAVDISIDIDKSSVLPVHEGRRSIGFLASFNHEPNVDAALFFAREIFPLVRKRIPDAKFVIAGKNPPPPLLEMKGQGVSCIGFVDNVSEFYAQVEVVVAPLRVGGGIKIKVLEAMACGKPVVTTSVGAEGIAGGDSGAVVVADEPEAFAAAVATLLADPALRDELGGEARLLMARNFSWTRVIGDIEGIYSALVRSQ